jgi:hypothetical protein
MLIQSYEFPSNLQSFFPNLLRSKVLTSNGYLPTLVEIFHNMNDIIIKAAKKRVVNAHVLKSPFMALLEK